MSWLVAFVVTAIAVLIATRLTSTNAMLNRLQTVMAGDAGSIGAAAALKVHLASAAFNPTAGLLLAGLTEATFVGYAALAAGIGTAETFTDPTAGGNRIIQLLEPAGGWHWQATGAAGLPQTIYGFYVTDNTTTTLWGAALFTTPITLSQTGDGVDIAAVRFQVPTTAMF